MQLKVDTRREGDLGIMEANGEVDMATAGMVRQAITELIGDGQADLVLDLSQVTFIDSTGLGILVGARKKVAHLDGSFAIVCANPRILRLFKITGLAEAIAIHPTIHDAITSVSADFPDGDPEPDLHP